MTWSGIRRKFGVSAAAVAVAGPAGAAAPAAEEKTDFTVVLAAAGDKKVKSSRSFVPTLPAWA